MPIPKPLFLCAPCLAAGATITCQLTLDILKLDRAPPCLDSLMEEREGALWCLEAGLSSLPLGSHDKLRLC